MRVVGAVTRLTAGAKYIFRFLVRDKISITFTSLSLGRSRSHSRYRPLTHSIRARFSLALDVLAERTEKSPNFSSSFPGV